MNRDVRIANEVNYVKSELDCCEYINIYGEKRSCLQCFCDCSALDSACDTLCSLDCNSTHINTGTWSIACIITGLHFIYLLIYI